MTKRSLSSLASTLASYIKSGFSNTKAADHRKSMQDVYDSFPNLVDGGHEFDAEVGYSSTLPLTDDRSFVHKKELDDRYPSGLTAGRALITDVGGKAKVSDVTETEIGHLQGIRSSVQQQIDASPWKLPVLVAADANVSGSLSGTKVIQTISCGPGSRVFLMAQVVGANNGPWDVNSGAWTRPKDFDSASDNLSGAKFPILAGTYAGHYVTVDTYPIILGTTSIQSSIPEHATEVQLALKADKRLTTNSQTGTSYTLALSDASGKVDLANSSAITLTVPPASSVAFTAGDQIIIRQKGAGQVTIAPGSGVTINCYNSRTKITGQYGMATLIYEGGDVWSLEGNLTT